MPLADDTFDMVFSAFGALQFVADARRWRRGGPGAASGRPFSFPITHPMRWTFPDDPDGRGLLWSRSYWDRTPYVETTTRRR